MSCDCSSSYSDSSYHHACRVDVPYPQVSHESVPSLIDNLVTALYGGFYNPQTQTGFITKSVVNGRIVWNIPCDPNNTAEISWLPRNDGEGLLCYLIRAFNAILVQYVTEDGVQTLTNKTLTAPVINNPTGIDATDIGAGAFGAGVTLAGTQITGVIPNANTTGTSSSTASTLVLRDGSGNFSAGTISADLTGNVTGSVTGSLTGNVTGNVTGNLTGNASTASSATTATNLFGGAAGSIPYQTSAGVSTFLPAGATGRLFVQNAGSPVWAIDHIGTNTNDSAAAGYVGEYVTASVAAGSAITLTTATTANITSISLTAGDWDVYGMVEFILTNATSVFGSNGYIGGISSTSSTLGAAGTYFNFPIDLTNKTGGFSFSAPTQRISIASTTTIYLVTQATFSTGGTSVKAHGVIRARRAR